MLYSLRTQGLSTPLYALLSSGYDHRRSLQMSLSQLSVGSHTPGMFLQTSYSISSSFSDSMPRPGASGTVMKPWSIRGLGRPLTTSCQ